MVIFEIIGEIVGQIIIEAIFNVPVKIYGWVTGKKTKLINGYRTEQKKFVKFSVARKFLLAWETDTEHLKCKLTDGLETMNEKFNVTDFQFRSLHQRTIIQPPTSISFYSFHFLVQWMAGDKTTTIGVVETARTAYTVYSDPDSENLIGKTDGGKKFFISLLDDHSKTQFLRINRDIRTIEVFDVLVIKSGLTH